MKGDQFRQLGMGYAVTGGILTARHLAFGPNSIRMEKMNGEMIHVSKVNSTVKSLDNMVPLWKQGNEAVVGPAQYRDEHKVSRDFCLLKDELIAGTLGVKTKVLQFRLKAMECYTTFHYRFSNGEYVLYKANGVTGKQPEEYLGTSIHPVETLPGDSGAAMLAGRGELVGMRVGVLRCAEHQPVLPVAINARQLLNYLLSVDMLSKRKRGFSGNRYCSQTEGIQGHRRDV